MAALYFKPNDCFCCTKSLMYGAKTLWDRKLIGLSSVIRDSPPMHILSAGER